MGRLARSPLFLMALTVFIDITGFGLILPLLPFWAERLGAGPVGVGLILTVYALAQFLFTPVLGSLSDRYGRRPVILISLLIEALGFALTALAGALPVLLAARFIGGLGSSNIGSAQAVVADVTPPEGRARGMGAIGAAIGLGFVVGPAVGGALTALGATVPFWAALGVALVNALLVWRFLPETRKRQELAAKRRKSPLFGGWSSLRYPAVARLVGINLLFTIAFTAMETVFPLFSQRVYGWTAEQNGYIFTYVGVVIVIMQGGLVGQLVKRFGEKALLVGGLALLAVGLALLPFSTTLGVLLPALGLLSAGDGAVSPTSSALLSFAGPAEAQGETLGLAQGVAGLGRIIGPLLAGSLFAVGMRVPFWFGAALVLLAGLVALPALPGVVKRSGSPEAQVAASDGQKAYNHTTGTPDEQELYTRTH
jgi:multidrug resistance protein